MAGRKVGVGGTLVFDSEGLAKLAANDLRARAHLEGARRRGAQLAVSVVTLTEVLRGGPRDARVHRLLRGTGIAAVPVSAELGRAAGELLGRTGMSGHRCAIDAIVAATALRMPRPVAVLTSDPDDLGRLVEEPACPKDLRVAVVKV
ncbi:type II toxin-antitoxin system VapC family toxin [Fodinicola acaciae]|uniref:type II toxin-antitoxin system VapC family toxin n=1 Tax=Fodinicola acaciae TaxID=2681555 RepID=UPI001C9E9C1A|nr:PIN domain-containing protein [Fodinicola acaciae]